MWVPPSGWQDFLANYSALQKLSVPSQYQRARDALLRAGGSFIAQSNAQETVFDDDISQWLFSAKALATKLNNASMAQTAQRGMDQPQGFFADDENYYDIATDDFHPLVHPFDAIGQVLKTPFEDAIIFGAAVLAIYVVAPAVIRAVRGK